MNKAAVQERAARFPTDLKPLRDEALRSLHKEGVMNTRTFHMGFVSHMYIDFLEHELRRCARKGAVAVEFTREAAALHFPGRTLLGIYKQEPITIEGVDLSISVSGGNAGSVDDYCGFYLQMIKDQPICRTSVESATYAYYARVISWRNGQRHACC